MSGTIYARGKAIPFPADMAEAVKAGQEIGEAMGYRGVPDVERKPCGCVTWVWRASWLQSADAWGDAREVYRATCDGCKQTAATDRREGEMREGAEKVRSLCASTSAAGSG